MMARRPKPQAAPSTRRASDDILASKAERLARDPTFTEFFDACYKQHLADLEAVTLDGTEKSEKDALAALYRFQALMELKRTIYQPIAKLRAKQLQEE
jgi:hypothetical protein